MEYPRPEEIDPREKLAILAEQELHQEEINHPEKTVYQRAFIKNFDDQAGYRDSVRSKYLRCPFFIAG